MVADVALAALRGLHETLNFVVALPGTFLFAGIFDFADEEGVQASVFPLPEEKAIGGEGVAPGAACLLVILLDALREREMNDRADGGFVNAQAEGHGADHDAHFVGHPFFLILAARGALHLAVIADGGDAVFLEEIDGVTHAGDSGSVDDDAAVRDLFDGSEEEFILRFGVALANNVPQIGAAKAGDVLVRIAQAELIDDVVADPLGGAGSESGDWAVGKELAEAAELAILGPEVVAPFGDAMCLIDREERDGHAAEPGGSAVEGDAFGREIEEAIVALAGAAKDHAASVAGK